MKHLAIALLSFSTVAAFAADFTMLHGQPSTVEVQGCGSAEVGDIKIQPSITGTHKLTSRCLPVFCVYTNETPYAFINKGTKWTILLSARDASKDSTSPVFKGEPQFDKRFDKVLHKGIKTKQERDQIIKSYLDEGTCKGVFFRQDVPAV